MQIRLLIICLFSTCCIGVAHAQRVSPTAECEISGQVTDLGGAVAGGGSVFFVSSSETKKAEIHEGKYRVSLHKGVFDIFMQYHKRARISVTCSDDPPINLYLLPACVSFGCDKLGADFDVFSKSDSKVGSNVVIAYFSKKKSGRELVYKKAILTYENFTLHAEQLTQDARTRATRAQGFCWIDDGNRKRKCERPEVDFAGAILNKESKLSTVSDIEYQQSVDKHFLRRGPQ